MQWAEKEASIIALLIVGSRAREISPAAQWSDLDLVVLAKNPTPYIEDTSRVEDIGVTRIIFLERTAVGEEIEIRVLFEGGFDVDFAIIPIEKIETNLQIFSGIAVRGIKILVDKVGFLSRIELGNAKITRKPPSYFDFSNSIKDFWYHTVCTTKKLLRGELWTAKSCCDGYMKGILLRMIEWYTLSKSGWDWVMSIQRKKRSMQLI